MIKLKIKKGDTVAVMTGKDRGKKGKVLRVFPERGVALVERVNLMKHFDKRGGANQAGGIIEREVPMPVSKLAVVCTHCSKPAKIGIRVSGDTRQRVCKLCEEAL